MYVDVTESAWIGEHEPEWRGARVKGSSLPEATLDSPQQLVRHAIQCWLEGEVRHDEVRVVAERQ